MSQYATSFARQDFIDLGAIHVEWFAQQSIRTLSRPEHDSVFDIKTSLSILNTSCYRGIPGNLIQQGSALSGWLATVVQNDAFLQASGLVVQQEVAGIFCPHPYQSQVSAGAYRYKEMLGCIWRERAESVVKDDEEVMSLSCLMQEDAAGRSCIDALISLSGMGAEHWLRCLFKHSVIPLYHLICRYGVSVVAHGQNVTLILKNHVPVGCTIKDFHGDLRIYEHTFPENKSLPLSIREQLTQLPARYLLHDLLTGNVVSTLRFISPKLTKFNVPETHFYEWLGQEIIAYQSAHPALASRFTLFDMMTDTIEKVCINQVRFKIGYGDSEHRPLPALGTPIPNPMKAAC